MPEDDPSSYDNTRVLTGTSDTFLSGYRHRIIFCLALVIGITATPFAIHNLIIGRFAIGVSLLTLAVVFIIDALALYLKKKPPVPVPLLIVPFAVTVALSIAAHGMYAIAWCSPGIMLCYFIMDWRIARWTSVGLVAIYVIMVYHYIGVAAAVRFTASALASIVAVNIIISVINDLQNKLLGQIVTDPLTGAFNRRHMNQILDDAIERNRRTGAHASILMIDIDHFKDINDTLGHAGGDEVLKGLATLITERSRKLDRLFRVGGEEFLLFLPDTKGSDAVVRAENVRRMIAATPLVAKRSVTASIGVSEISNDITFETWLKRADDALYSAKRAGRDRVVYAPLPLAPNPFAGTESAQPAS